MGRAGQFPPINPHQRLEPRGWCPEGCEVPTGSRLCPQETMGHGTAHVCRSPHLASNRCRPLCCESGSAPACPELSLSREALLQDKRCSRVWGRKGQLRVSRAQSPVPPGKLLRGGRGVDTPISIPLPSHPIPAAPPQTPKGAGNPPTTTTTTALQALIKADQQ